MEILLFTYVLFCGWNAKMCEDRSCADFLISQGARYDDGNNEGKTVGVESFLHFSPSGTQWRRTSTTWSPTISVRFRMGPFPRKGHPDAAVGGAHSCRRGGRIGFPCL